MSELHWHALRRPLRSCAIGAVLWLAFLSLWQFLVPGDTDARGGFRTWALLVAAAGLLAFGLILPFSAGHRLWSAGRRRAAFGPVSCLLLGLVGIPWLASAAGAHPSVVLACLPFVLLASALGSALVILSVADAPRSVLAQPLPVEGPHGDADIHPEDPSGYARDVPVERGR
ncbi:MAG TPA: hypothetical protein VFS67_31815 [Polyangiaceae bacterium]|nr:hypothetical protein [Polyangiaceae bacterium]